MIPFSSTHTRVDSTLHDSVCTFYAYLGSTVCIPHSIQVNYSKLKTGAFDSALFAVEANPVEPNVLLSKEKGDAVFAVVLAVLSLLVAFISASTLFDSLIIEVTN